MCNLFLASYQSFPLESERNCFLYFFLQIIMAIVSSWVICAIITAAGGFPSDPDNPNYLARTDREVSVLKEAKWFRFPYPGKAKSTVIFLSLPSSINQVFTVCLKSPIA